MDEFWTTFGLLLDEFRITCERLSHDLYTTFKAALDNLCATLGKSLDDCLSAYEQFGNKNWGRFDKRFDDLDDDLKDH